MTKITHQNELYSKNLSFFQKHHQDLFQTIVDHKEVSPYQLYLYEYNKDGKVEMGPNIQIIESQQFIYQTNPIAIARDGASLAIEKDFFLQLSSDEKQKETNIEKIIFVANGLGFYLVEYTKRYDIKSILVVEDDINLFLLSLALVDYDTISKDKLLHFSIGEPLEKLENHVLLFFNSLFIYNDSLWISQYFQNNSIGSISKILMDNINTSLVLKRIDYDSILQSDIVTIESPQKCQEEYKVICKDMEDNNNFQNTYIPKLLNILSFLFSHRDNPLSTYKNIIYINILLFKMTSILKKHDEITRYCRNYIVEIDKFGKFDKSLYQHMVQTTRATNNLKYYEYFLDRYITFLQHDDSTGEKDYIEYQKYVLKNLQTDSPNDEPLENYIKILFDKSADIFEDHLLNTLEYNAPTLLFRSLKKVLDRDKKYTILDLGCGTGLMGEQLVDLCKEMVGIDLSSKMLEKAKEKSIYTDLFEVNLNSFHTSKENKSKNYELIVAADVFVYIGDLHDAFNSVDKLLTTKGIFGFTVEALDENSTSDFLVNSGGKVAHSKNYIEQLISEHNFKKLQFEKIILRKDGGKDVKGYLVLVEQD